MIQKSGCQNSFLVFFVSKIEKIRNQINEKIHISPLDSVSLHLPVRSLLTSFQPATDFEVRCIIKGMKDRSCPLDPIPTWLTKECLDELVPHILAIIIVGRPTSSIVPKNIKIGISCYKLVSISI